MCRFLRIIFILSQVFHGAYAAISARDYQSMHVTMALCGVRSVNLYPSALGSLLYHLPIITPMSNYSLNITILADAHFLSHARHILNTLFLPSEVTLHLVDAQISMNRLMDARSPFITQDNIHRFSCAFTKLDLPYLLWDQKYSLFLDVDILLLEGLSSLWTTIIHESSLSIKNAQHKWMYLVRESEGDQVRYRPGKQHFVRPRGVNSGVIFMNLTQLRADGMSMKRFMEINDESLDLADQDVINTVGYYNSSRIGFLPCKWNKQLGSGCSDGENMTVGIHHGTGGAFEKPRLLHQPHHIKMALNFYYYYFECVVCPRELCMDKLGLWDKCDAEFNVTAGMTPPF